MTNLFTGGVTDYALPNQYTMTCSEDPDTGSGTYSVDSDGDLSISYDDGPMPGAVSPNGEVLILSEADCDLPNHYCSMGLGVGVKKGSEGTSSLVGNFTVYEFESGFHGGEAGWAWGANDQQFLIQTNFNFNGSGNYTETLDEYKHNRQIIDGPMTNLFDSGVTDYALPNQYTMDCPTISGETGASTYSVTSGIVTLNYGDVPMTGVLSASGNVLLLSESDCDDDDRSCSMVLGVGVKRGASMELTDLQGTFVVYEYESGFHGGEAGGAWGMNDEQFMMQSVISFDGSGECTILSLDEYRQNRELIDGQKNLFPGGDDTDDDYALANQHTTTCSLTTEPSGETKTYSLSSTGTITINYDDGPMYGVLSADTNVLILSESECSDNDKYCSMVLGVGVKKGSAMSNSSLNGDYEVYTFESGFHSPPPEAQPSTINPGVLQLLLLPGTL